MVMMRETLESIAGSREYDRSGQIVEYICFRLVNQNYLLLFLMQQVSLAFQLSALAII